MDGAGLNPEESAVFENRMKMLEVEQATMWGWKEPVRA